MTPAGDVGLIGSGELGVTSKHPSTFDPSPSLPVGRSVSRFPEQLRMHHALEELDLTGVVNEVSEAARSTCQGALEPILITQNGMILAGFERWRLALLEEKRELDCIEYPISDGDSLPIILTYHRGKRGWNPFVRIRLALKMEPYFQQKAFENMRAGGKYKGSAKLPDLQHINVRQELAAAAAVGTRNVTKVKTILQLAHPRLLEALRDGTLTINRAMEFCQYPKGKQLEQFTRAFEERAIARVIAQSVKQRPKVDRTRPDVGVLLHDLQEREARQPGSVLVLFGRLKHTVILIGKDINPAAFSKGVELI